jgi:hypothetical protein
LVSKRGSQRASPNRVTHITLHKEKYLMSFLGAAGGGGEAVLILSKARSRHLVQGNLVSRSSLVSCVFKVCSFFQLFPKMWVPQS